MCGGHACLPEGDNELCPQCEPNATASQAARCPLSNTVCLSLCKIKIFPDRGSSLFQLQSSAQGHGSEEGEAILFSLHFSCKKTLRESELGRQP